NSGHSSTDDAIENISLASDGQSQMGRRRNTHGRRIFLSAKKQQMTVTPNLLSSSTTGKGCTRSMSSPSEMMSKTGRSLLFCGKGKSCFKRCRVRTRAWPMTLSPSSQLLLYPCLEKPVYTGHCYSRAAQHP